MQRSFTQALIPLSDYYSALNFQKKISKKLTKIEIIQFFSPLLEKTFFDFKKWVKGIQTTSYNVAHTVHFELPIIPVVVSEKWTKKLNYFNLS